MKIGIVGFGNLGKGIAKRASFSEEFELVGIFSRRKINSSFAPVYRMEELYGFKERIDCLLLAGGSFSDLPSFSPALAKDFNIVDSFDTHAKIKEHFLKIDSAAASGSHAAIISAGWDPGIFSLFRLLGKSLFLDAKLSTFWGRGVSQGHSEAIKRVDGVKYAIEYTVPKESAMDKARYGISCDAKKAHIRECYVVAEAGREREIEEKIKTIPEYFLGYETIVNFVSEEEFLERHNLAYHGGRVISFGKTGSEESDAATIELSIKMDSNPDFTAGIMLAYARAAKRFFDMGDFGAKTPLHVPLSFLYNEELFDLI